MAAEEESLDMSVLAIVIPAILAVVLVVVTVVLVFWLGAGRQTSYEDAVRARQGRAEKELRKMAEKEREQRLKKEKKRPGRNKRHEAGRLESQAEVEATPQQQPPAQKSILKTGGKANSVAKDKSDSSSAVRVDFEVSETPARPSKTPRTNPPTPHPSAQRRSHPLAQPLARALEPEVGEEENDEEPDEGGIPRVPRIELPKKKSHHDEDQPQSKPKAVVSQPVTAVATKSAAVGSARAAVVTKTTSATGGSRGQKKTKKSKSSAGLGEVEALPASRISDIVGASMLADEEIQHLIDQLLEMMDANAEWKGANKGTESVKSLKKANEDLQKRCEDAEKTVHGHYQLIKNLRAEIKTEQSRRQASEAQLQGRITKHSQEISVSTTKISGLEEELKQTRQLSTSQTIQKLEEEKATLTHQMDTLHQENVSLTGQLASKSKSLQEAQDQSTKLHSELRRAKTAAKSPTGGAEGRGQIDRAAELEGRLRQAEEDNASLQAALTSVGKEKDQLVEQVQGLATASQERDSLSQQLSTAQHQLQETQAAVQAMEQKGAEGEASSATEIARLKEQNAQLGARVDSLQQQASGATAAATAELRRLEEENAQLGSRVDSLQQQASGATAGATAAATAELRRLEEENAQLGSRVDSLQQQASGATAAATAELRQLEEENARLMAQQQQAVESASAAAAEVQQLREVNARLGTQVEGLQSASNSAAAATEAAMVVQQQPNGPSHEEVEELKSQLKVAHQEEQQALLAKMEAERTSEVMGLKAQYEAELNCIKEELSRVQREGDAARSSAEQRLASETAQKQELQSELESLKTTALSSQYNGPVDDQVDAGQEEVLRAKEDELAKVEEERDELKLRLKNAESKLSDLQGKNTSLRDNCWKARDDSAKFQKESEAKLKQVYRETESRIKAAEVRVAEEKEEGERALLQRLFPDVRVAETTSFSVWVDQFEVETQLSLDSTNKQVCELKERVEELQETEQTYIREAEGFRETLNQTFGNLAKLQEEVTVESVQHQHLLEEREEMLQRERETNRDLQQQLSKERTATANLEAKIKKAGEGGEERVRELEGQLEEVTQGREELRHEVDHLTTSLDQATLVKTQADDSDHQLKSRCEEKKLQDTEESIQPQMDLGKLGQSIISSDSTEV